MNDEVNNEPTMIYHTGQQPGATKGTDKRCGDYCYKVVAAHEVAAAIEAGWAATPWELSKPEESGAGDGAKAQAGRKK